MSSHDTIATRGFLSKELEQYRLTYRAQHESYLSACEEKSHAANAQLFAAELKYLDTEALRHVLLALDSGAAACAPVRAPC
ncbi:hypothetical protein GTP91_18005 [Rugamonas sp. FT82W]|uniref:Uncharacterized protein n=1 Tax=Duganella vulcania TaxID=2692166 RepID=A0A845G8H5_9BURK|nr:hypothetical protein [Duganella vulcania]MYM89058.1 hypothetical protein [Duganella vulcania]